MAVGILDYGLGNVGSIINMLHYVTKEKVILINNRKQLHDVNKLILPGVGKFDSGVDRLQELALFDAIKEFALDDRNAVLGICLGMQLLGNKSEEGLRKGLGLIDFDVVRFEEENIKVPHMGWEYVNFQGENVFSDKLKDANSRYYFVHSYYARCKAQKDIMATSHYMGHAFVAGVCYKRIYGVQFHPEKSHRYGKELLRVFVEEC